MWLSKASQSRICSSRLEKHFFEDKLRTSKTKCFDFALTYFKFVHSACRRHNSSSAAVQTVNNWRDDFWSWACQIAGQKFLWVLQCHLDLWFRASLVQSRKTPGHQQLMHLMPGLLASPFFAFPISHGHSSAYCLAQPIFSLQCLKCFYVCPLHIVAVAIIQMTGKFCLWPRNCRWAWPCDMHPRLCTLLCWGLTCSQSMLKSAGLCSEVCTQQLRHGDVWCSAIKCQWNNLNTYWP